MGTGFHGGFGQTFGAKEDKTIACTKSERNKLPIFDCNGHVTKDSISARAEFFLGKSVSKIENVLTRHGYVLNVDRLNIQHQKQKLL